LPRWRAYIILKPIPVDERPNVQLNVLTADALKGFAGKWKAEYVTKVTAAMLIIDVTLYSLSLSYSSSYSYSYVLILIIILHFIAFVFFHDLISFKMVVMQHAVSVVLRKLS
jgi:hypothetical protein